MKFKCLFIMGFIVSIAIVLVIGCSSKEGKKGIKDCGNDIGCFAESSKTCSPAKLNYFTTFEIKGVENGKCILIRTVQNFTDTCKFNTADLTSMLNRWKTGAFSTDDWNVAECGK